MILPAVISDSEKLTEIALQSKAYWKYSPNVLESWRNDLTVTANMISTMNVFKYIIDFNIVGFYILSKPQDSSIELDFLFIHPDFIGKNIGKALIMYAFEFAKKLDCKTMSVISDPNAKNFYLHFGFIIIDQKTSSIKNRLLPVLQKTL